MRAPVVVGRSSTALASRASGLVLEKSERRPWLRFSSFVIQAIDVTRFTRARYSVECDVKSVIINTITVSAYVPIAARW